MTYTVSSGTLNSTQLNTQLGSMTLIYELDLDVSKTYLLTENEVSRSMLSNVGARTARTDEQTDRQMQPNVLADTFEGLCGNKVLGRVKITHRPN